MPELVETSDFLVRMLTGLMGGVLIGLERERAHISRRQKAASIPGLRTFGLVSLYGSLSSFIASTFSGSIPGAGLILPASIAVILAFIALYAYVRMMHQRAMGITTYIVILNAYLVGVLAGIGLVLEAASTAVLITIILAIKTPALRLARALRYSELIAMLEIAAIFLILGPLIQAYSTRIQFIDIFKVYLFFAIVLLLSFTSYVAARIWGARGLIYATALGSLVNSEAMIGSVTRIIGEIEGRDVRASLLGRLTSLVISVMQLRASLLAIAALYIFGGLEALESSMIIMLPLIVASIIILTATTRTGASVRVTLAVESPLSWGTAAKSAVAYLILAMAATIAAREGYMETVSIIGFIGGWVNATATILSLSSIIGSVDPCSVISGILLSIATATLNKLLYADTTGLDRSEVAILRKWSIGLSTLPFSLAVLALLC
ncbi:MAG: DUF4010 domain-containing protein [Desulfurococcales archaeon]|nr:DUF4010 domain-containing protein [Desulfurococcales archaeon]